MEELAKILLIYFPLGIAILVLFFLFLWKGGSWGLSSITDMIGQWFGTTSPEEKTLVKAMTCAYDRCIDGCNSGNVKQINWEDENGDKVSCLANFCKDEWRDSEGKICGDMAKDHPVNVYLDTDVKITLDYWGMFFKKPATQFESYIVKRPCEPREMYALINPTSAIVVPEETECDDAKTADIFDRVDNCNLPAGYYNIWSGKSTALDKEDIIICSAE